MPLRRFHMRMALACAGFVSVTIVTAVYLRDQLPNEGLRMPSSILYNDKGVIVQSETQLLDERPRSGALRGHAMEGGIFAEAPNPGSELTALIEAKRRTGLPAIRARKVVFDREAFAAAVTDPGRLKGLELFPDFTLGIRFGKSSALSLNDYIYVAGVDGDSRSNVTFMIQGEKMSARIRARNRDFQIVDLADGYHYIVELDPKRK